VLVEMVPADASIYATAYLDPAAEQKVKVRNLVGKFPALKDTDELNRRLDQMLNEALADTGLTSVDIRPWLGSQVGVALRVGKDEQFAVAFLIRSKDDAAAQSALGKLRTGPQGSGVAWKDEQYGGITLSTTDATDTPSYGLIEHTVVLASQADFLRDLVDAQQDKIEDLASSATYQETVGSLPQGRLGLGYMNVSSLAEALRTSLGAATAGAAAIPGLEQLDAVRGLAATVSAKSDGLAAEFTTLIDRSKLTAEAQKLFAPGTGENAALGFTPASAYGVFATVGFKSGMESLLDLVAQTDPSFDQTDAQLGLSDAVRHLTGETAIEARPGTAGYPGGAWLLGTDDEGSMQRLLDRAADQLGLALADPFTGIAPSVRHETYGGADIGILSTGNPDLERFGVEPAYAVSQGMAIIASSPDEVKAALDAKSSGSAIATGERFKEALAEAPGDKRFVIYLDVQAIAAAVRTALDPSAVEEFDRQVAPNLTPVKRFIMNSQNEGDRSTIRMFVLIR